MGLRVLIAGGGLGGLCLAPGLRKRGVECAVYEQEVAPSGNDGYRIHINQTGSRALNECLPPALWDAFVATAGQPWPEQRRLALGVPQLQIDRGARAEAHVHRAVLDHRAHAVNRLVVAAVERVGDSQ